MSYLEVFRSLEKKALDSYNLNCEYLFNYHKNEDVFEKIYNGIKVLDCVKIDLQLYYGSMQTDFYVRYITKGFVLDEYKSSYGLFSMNTEDMFIMCDKLQDFVSNSRKYKIDKLLEE